MVVDEGSDQKSDVQPQWIAAHAGLKIEFTEGDKCHNLGTIIAQAQHLPRRTMNRPMDDYDRTCKLNGTVMKFEPAHEIMALFVLRKLIFQSRMRSQDVGLDV